MFCPECGAPNEDEAIFCGNCGMVLNAEGLAEDRPVESAEGLIVDSEQDAGIFDVGEDSLPAVPPPPSLPRAPTPVYKSGTQTNGMAIASLVMGIAGWTVLPFLGSVLAIIFGYVARKEIRQRPDKFTGGGMAVVGLVLGWLMVGISVVALCLGLVALFLFFGSVGSGTW
jgi:hypothetical protein